MKLDGYKIADKLYSNLKTRVEKLKKQNIIPHLVVFLVGENPASIAYVKQKQKNGKKIGAKVTVLRYGTSVTTEELKKNVKLLNDDPFVHGILIQRPLPKHIDVDKLVILTDPQKDIDGFHPDSPYTLPLPLAVIKILEEIYFQTNPQSSIRNPQFIPWLQNQNIVLLGKGPTGGGPIIEYLKTLDVTPHLIDSRTEEPEKLIKQADIVISAIGRKNIVKPETLKKNVVLISVGINRDENNKLHGDYDEEKIKDIASYYTPTPGGVGPVNVATLWDNLLTATEKQNKK